MYIQDILNRYLLNIPDMADEIDYTYNGDGLITSEVRTIRTVMSERTVTRKITVTYTRDGSGNVTKKTQTIETIEG